MPKYKMAPLKERLWERFSESLLNFAASLPMVKRGLLHWLQNVRREPRLTRNACPKGVSLDLHCLWMCEIIQIEDFERQIPAILRLLQDHKTKRFTSLGRSSKDLLAILRGFKEGILGSSWCNVDLLDFANVGGKVEVEYMILELECLAGGHVAFYFRVIPKDSFKKRVSNIIENECPPHITISPPRNLRSFFRGRWGWRTIPGELRKQNELQKVLVEFKSECARYLRTYISGLVLRPKYLLPSVELWIREDNSQEADNKEERPFNTFWDSVGLSKAGWETYVEPSGTFSAILPSGDRRDIPIKIVYENKQSPPTSGAESSESRAESLVNDWIPTLLGLWSIRLLYRDLLDEVGNHRLRLFSKIWRIGARTAFRWSRQLFFIEIQYSRLEKDFKLENYPRDFNLCGFPDFRKTLHSKHVSVLKEDLIGNTKDFLQSLKGVSTSSQRLLKSKIDSLVVSTNYWTQLAVVFLAFATLVLSFLMVITGTLSINSRPKICDSPKVTWFCESAGRLLKEK